MKNILIFLVAFTVTGNSTSNYQYGKLGGTLSTNKSCKKSFSVPPKSMTHDEEDMFILGKSFFRVPWVEAPSATTARDGLGPLFNANTCITCHPNNGAGVAVTKNGTMTRSHLLRLSHKNPKDMQKVKTIGFEPDSMYGAQLSLNGNHSVPYEGKVSLTYNTIDGTYPDGTTYSLRKPHYTITKKVYGAFDKETIFAPRIGTPLIGLGLLEDIPQKDILNLEDINDSNHDGISGKANLVYSPETNKTTLGRFTWKASASTVKVQSAAAAHNDMGLSNPLFPSDNCSEKQEACLKAPKGKHTFDLPGNRLDAITYYVSNLSVPNQRNPKQHTKGAKLFKTLNCTACHVTTHKTVNGETIHPFTDLLVHDMGEGLADGRSEFLADGREWRTAPLWGIGLYKTVSGEANYLHDGRARTIEEAILWHGGEAQKSKNAFMALDKKSRAQVLQFLHSL
ncbi:MAG: thiol oxidoreductase [Epsilonproteobacteria bacterium]|nr:thiol oxidoreductase [Campylobacterota bacterium]